MVAIPLVNFHVTTLIEESCILVQKKYRPGPVFSKINLNYPSQVVKLREGGAGDAEDNLARMAFFC